MSNKRFRASGKTKYEFTFLKEDGSVCCGCSSLRGHFCGNCRAAFPELFKETAMIAASAGSRKRMRTSGGRRQEAPCACGGGKTCSTTGKGGRRAPARSTGASPGRRAAELSDVALREQLASRLYESIPAFLEIVEVRPDAGTVVYVTNPDGVYIFYEVTFTVLDDTVSITGEPIQVTPSTKYDEVSPTAAQRAASHYLFLHPKDPYNIAGLSAAARRTGPPINAGLRSEVEAAINEIHISTTLRRQFPREDLECLDLITLRRLGKIAVDEFKQICTMRNKGFSNYVPALDSYELSRVKDQVRAARNAHKK